ncbi:hypothetical protein J4205_04300 [Candidatus Pacearchaeota archaeon]|nr:hypothetical protein [Candidatus Pacearchaeota archaeon]
MALSSQLSNELIITLILIILQIITVYFAYMINKKLGGARFWMLIIIALSVIIVRRITTILILFEVITPGPLINQIDNIYIPLIFWAFMGLGMYGLYNKLKKDKK